MLNFNEGVLLDSGPSLSDEDPLRRRSFMMNINSLALYTAQRQDPWFSESFTLPDHPHILNIIMPLHQRGLLWIAAGDVACQSQQSRAWS